MTRGLLQFVALCVGVCLCIVRPQLDSLALFLAIAALVALSLSSSGERDRS